MYERFKQIQSRRDATTNSSATAITTILNLNTAANSSVRKVAVGFLNKMLNCINIYV